MLGNLSKDSFKGWIIRKGRHCCNPHTSQGRKVGYLWWWHFPSSCKTSEVSGKSILKLFTGQTGWSKYSKNFLCWHTGEIRIYVTSWSLVKLLGLPILVEQNINAIVLCLFLNITHMLANPFFHRSLALQHRLSSCICHTGEHTPHSAMCTLDSESYCTSCSQQHHRPPFSTA